MTERVVRNQGFTLIEMMVVVAIIGILAGLAVPRLRDWMADNRVRETAMQVADAFHLARTEAMRTGNNHMVFLGADLTLTPLTASGRDYILVLNDGPPGAPPDCTASGGEPQRRFYVADGVQIAVTHAGAKAPADTGPGPMPLSFEQPPPNAGNFAAWVLFRPDGVPVGVTNGCVEGDLGSGGGAVYLSNGRVDYSISLTQLGAVRVSAWERGTGSWN